MLLTRFERFEFSDCVMSPSVGSYSLFNREWSKKETDRWRSSIAGEANLSSEECPVQAVVAGIILVLWNWDCWCVLVICKVTAGFHEENAFRNELVKVNANTSIALQTAVQLLSSQLTSIHEKSGIERCV
jgi:hypothetical protein